MSEGVAYKSEHSSEKPVVFVDAEEYGDIGCLVERWNGDECNERYTPGTDRRFLSSTGKKSLDLEVIMVFLEKQVDRMGIGAGKKIIAEYFVPVQDEKEIKRRQAVVKELYENEDVMEAVHSIITSANRIERWDEGFVEGSEGCFSIRTEQINNLVTMVESSLKLNPKSECLQSVKKFAQKISKLEGYSNLKKYATQYASELFKDYVELLEDTEQLWEMHYDSNLVRKTLQSVQERKNLRKAELLKFYKKMTEDKYFANKIRRLSLETRREIYSSIKSLKNLLHGLMHDKSLAHIIDREEVRDFQLEERLDEGIKRLRDFSTLDYRTGKKMTTPHRFFIKQFGSVLSHIELLIDEGLENSMGAFQVETNGLEKELAFYYSLAELAKFMAKSGPIAMPTLLDKEKRYCEIVKGNVPSFIVRGGDGNQGLVANDAYSDPGSHVFVITGPNDGGKTTYERMVGQIQVLAQSGSFVPAKKAAITIVDGVFTSFGAKDKPGEKEGSFKSGLRFLSYISSPALKPKRKRESEEEWRLSVTANMREVYAHYDQSFITPFSLVLLDEIAIGSDSEATDEAIRRTIKLGLARGARMYISTHHHPAAVLVQKGKFPGAVNLGAVMDLKHNPPSVTYKIIPNLHAPSYGSRMFGESGFTDKKIAEGHQLLKEAGIIK